MKLLILLFIIKNYQLLFGAIFHEYYENEEYFYDYDIKGERFLLIRRWRYEKKLFTH